MFYLSGDELKQTVSIVVDLATVLDPDGVDIYFLNREPMFNVRNSQELVHTFAVPPEGLYISSSFFINNNYFNNLRSNTTCSCSTTDSSREKTRNSRKKTTCSYSYRWRTNR